jgi:UDP-N-acetylmuramoyl-tripeptide--D-alanyl-D-alanine ligase
MAEGAHEEGMGTAQIVSFEDSDAAARYVADSLQPGDLVLVKGSRGIKMDKIVALAKTREN